MRTILILGPLLMMATPVLAQSPATTPPASAEIQRALTDPVMADKLANAMQALSKAFGDLPVGEVQAAVEGRKPTAAEKKRTLRDLARRDDPNFDRNLQRQITEAKPMIQASMKALAEALPAMMQSLEQAGRAMERAAANMPDPTYPKR